MGGIRRASVKAISTCELQSLSKRNLNMLLAEYPGVDEELKSIAQQRAQETELRLKEKIARRRSTLLLDASSKLPPSGNQINEKKNNKELVLENCDQQICAQNTSERTQSVPPHDDQLSVKGFSKLNEEDKNQDILLQNEDKDEGHECEKKEGTYVKNESTLSNLSEEYLR